MLPLLMFFLVLVAAAAFATRKKRTTLRMATIYSLRVLLDSLELGVLWGLREETRLILLSFDFLCLQ